MGRCYDDPGVSGLYGRLRIRHFLPHRKTSASFAGTLRGRMWYLYRVIRAGSAGTILYGALLDAFSPRLMRSGQKKGAPVDAHLRLRGGSVIARISSPAPAERHVGLSRVRRHASFGGGFRNITGPSYRIFTRRDSCEGILQGRLLIVDG